MTGQEKFEQLIRDGACYASATNSAYQADMAAKQDSAAEIAQLQADNLKLRNALELDIQCNLNEQEALDNYIEITNWTPDVDSEKAFRYAYKHGFKYAPINELE